MSVLLKNGLVVTSTGSTVADGFVEGESIKAVGTGLTFKADETVDATGKYILPGSIDPACGVTTCIVDFNLQGKGETLKDAVDKQKAKADGKTVVDYSVHPGV